MKEWFWLARRSNLLGFLLAVVVQLDIVWLSKLFFSLPWVVWIDIELVDPDDEDSPIRSVHVCTQEPL